MKVKVREMQEGDLSGYRAVFTIGYYHSIYREWLLRGMMENRERPPKDAGCLVAIVEGKIVGLLVYRSEEDRIDVEELVVLPDHRRCGVAKALIKELSRMARLRGINKIQATVPYGQFEDDPGLALLLTIYGKLGFSLEGIGVWVRCEGKVEEVVEVLGRREGGYLYIYEKDLEILDQQGIKYEVVESWGRNYNLVMRVSQPST